MSIRLYQTLVAIAETGSFAAAAERMHITQSAVSQQMKRLEEMVGRPLFEKDGRQVRLTRLANEMLPSARDLIERNGRMLAAARDEPVPGGELVLGTTPSSLSALVPLALKQMYARQKGLQVRVVPRLSADLLMLVERGAVDAAVISGPPPSRPGMFHDDLEFRPVAREQLMVICAAGVRENEASKVLATLPYICMSPSAWVSELAASAIRELGIRPNYSLELDSLESVMSVVAHGLGAAIVPKPCISDERAERLKFLPLGIEPLDRQIGILCRAGNGNRAIIEALHAALNAVVRRETRRVV